MRMSLERKVGIFFVLTLIVFITMIELSGGKGWFEDKFEYTTYFSSAVGINPGDPVKIAGVTMGKVEKISLSGNQARVDFYLSKENVLKKDSIAEIHRANLLGGVFVGITLGSPNAQFAPTGSIIDSRDVMSIHEVVDNFGKFSDQILNDFSETSSQVREKVTTILDRVDKLTADTVEGKNGIGKILNDDQLHDDITVIAKEMRVAASKLNDQSNTLSKLMSSPELYDDLAITAENLKSVSGDLKHGEGTLSKLMHDDSLYNNLNMAVSNISAATENMANDKSIFNLITSNEEAHEQFAKLLENMTTISGKIAKGEGTVGRLVYDEEIYVDAKRTLNKLERTAESLKDTGPVSSLGSILGALF